MSMTHHIDIVRHKPAKIAYRRPYNLYRVGADVKPGSINQLRRKLNCVVKHT